MLRLTSDILIDTYRFRGVVEAAVASSWDELTDTCTLTIPRKLVWQGKEVSAGADPLLRRGQAVSVSLGYDDENHPTFSGWVHRVQAQTPVVIECQDDMWRLKQTQITNSYRSVNLRTLVGDILPAGIPFEALDVELGPYRISQATPSQVLEDLKKTFFFKSWFRGGKLYVGLAYVPELQSTHIIRMERNVPAHNLEYQKKEDVRIKLKMISIGADNKKVEYETGAEDGEQRTMHYYQLSLAEMKAIADEEIERLRYEGYNGSFTTFGAPRIQHGDVVDLRSDAYPERDGRYLVRAVTTTFGVSGFRQEVTLDSKLGI